MKKHLKILIPVVILAAAITAGVLDFNKSSTSLDLTASLVEKNKEETKEVKITEEEKDKPVFISGNIEPKKVAPGDKVIVTVEIKDNYGITEVTADMGGLATIKLELKEGNTKQGTWQGAWLAKGTGPKWYQTIIYATNSLEKQSTMSINWEDPTITDDFSDASKVAATTNVVISGGTVELAIDTFVTGYGKRKYLGFTNNDAVLENYQIRFMFYKSSGTDADKKCYLGSNVRDDFNDARLYSIDNIAQEEWKEYTDSGTKALKWFKVTKIYSSILTSNAAGAQQIVNINDASGFAANDWVIITRDNETDELIQIDSISTNELTMKINLVNAYTTADNAKVMLAYYIYYDYASESDQSDMTNTFIFKEEWANLDNWTLSDVPAVSGGNLICNNDDRVNSNANYGYGVAVRSRAKASEQDSCFCGFRNVAYTQIGGTMASSDFTGVRLSEIRLRVMRDSSDIEVWEDGIDSDFRNIWYRWEVRRHSATKVTGFQEADDFSSSLDHWVIDNATYVSPDDISLFAMTWDSTQESTLTSDWVVVRKYQTTEPAGAGFGSEETK